MSSELFTPFKLGPVTLRNRTIRSAAFENMCPGNKPSQMLFDYHTSVARGGVGMTTVAYCAVDKSGVSFDGQLYVRDEIKDDLRKLTDAIHKEGAKASIQLGHCGNMTHFYTCGQLPVGASTGFNMYSPTPVRGLKKLEIKGIVHNFGKAVDFCRECGFDCVEIHAGHGYLISQFISPYTNHRRDEYGGSLQNRMRFMNEVLDEVMLHAGSDMAVVVKTNMYDGFKSGMQVDDCITVAKEIQKHGVHGMVLTAGFVSKAPMVVLGGAMPLKTLAHYMNPWKFWWLKMGLAIAGRLLIPTVPYKETYFLETAKRFRREIPDANFIYVGGIQSRENCETVLQEGFPLIQMAHVLIQDPAFVNHMREAEERDRKEGMAYRSQCKRSNYCVGRMYTLEMRCHECVENMPKSLQKEIDKAEADNAKRNCWN
ncbi:MAG: NADH:flavin oxidoreductase [Paludibacteraceae bacterium]|nr:NADH:flavin oxidoreductase [Paludibacteraceae bacterium]